MHPTWGLEGAPSAGPVLLPLGDSLPALLPAAPRAGVYSHSRPGRRCGSCSPGEAVGAGASGGVKGGLI